MSQQLIDITCPNVTKKKKQGIEYEDVCDRKLIKVYPGSSGEAYCWTCKYRFTFEVARDNLQIYDILKSSDAKPSV